MIQLDRHLLFLINHAWTHPALDRVLGVLSCLDFWVPLMVVGGVWFMARRGMAGVACLLLCGLGVLVNETLVAQPLKHWTARPRPYQSEAGIRRVDLAPGKPRVLSLFKPLSIQTVAEPDQNGTRRSFPSAHTLNAMTLGLVLARFLRSRIWWGLPPMMAWSRVYTGSHWPSDVLASLLLGFLLTQALLLLARKAAHHGVFPLRHAKEQLEPAPNNSSVS
jgi:undecaprenyl-diphosphatase